MRSTTRLVTKRSIQDRAFCFITRAFSFEGPRVIQARGEAALKVLDSSLSLQMMLSRSPTRNATCSLMRVASRRPSFVVCSCRLCAKHTFASMRFCSCQSAAHTSRPLKGGKPSTTHTAANAQHKPQGSTGPDEIRMRLGAVSLRSDTGAPCPKAPLHPGVPASALGLPQDGEWEDADQLER